MRSFRCNVRSCLLSPGAGSVRRQPNRRTRALRHRARRLCLSLPRPHAAAGQRRRTGADGLYGVAPAQPNGRTVVLLHGRNFPSSYWAPVIKTLSDAGYRVVVPDQIGFGKSSKPLADLHFDTLARNTIALLDHLGVAKADIVAHSFGGMLGRADRARLSGPDRASGTDRADRAGGLPATCRDADRDADEGKLTATAIASSSRTNYALKTAARTGHAVHRRAIQHQGQRRISRWLRAFVSSAQLIYREPVVHEIR